MLAKKSGNIINMASVASNIKGKGYSTDLFTIDVCKAKYYAQLMGAVVEV